MTSRTIDNVSQLLAAVQLNDVETIKLSIDKFNLNNLTKIYELFEILMINGIKYKSNNSLILPISTRVLNDSALSFKAIITFCCLLDLAKSVSSPFVPFLDLANFKAMSPSITCGPELNWIVSYLQGNIS